MTIEFSAYEILQQGPKLVDWSFVYENPMNPHDKARHWYEMGYRWFRVFDTTLKGWETFAYKDIPNSLTVVDVFPVSVPPLRQLVMYGDIWIDGGDRKRCKAHEEVEMWWDFMKNSSRFSFETFDRMVNARYLSRFFRYKGAEGRWYANKLPEGYEGEFAINPIGFLVSFDNGQFHLRARHDASRLQPFLNATMLWPSGEYTDKTLT